EYSWNHTGENFSEWKRTRDPGWSCRSLPHLRSCQCRRPAQSNARPVKRFTVHFHLQSPLMHYRSDNRTPEQMRPVNIVRDFITTAEGAVLIEVGNTRVICTASIEETVPTFMRSSGKGWITSEYGMLPRSTLTRSVRDATKGRQSGRTH